jgi:hypothetical protein
MLVVFPKVFAPNWCLGFPEQAPANMQDRRYIQGPDFCELIDNLKLRLAELGRTHQRQQTPAL